MCNPVLLLPLFRVHYFWCMWSLLVKSITVVLHFSTKPVEAVYSLLNELLAWVRSRLNIYARGAISQILWERAIKEGGYTYTSLEPKILFYTERFARVSTKEKGLALFRNVNVVMYTLGWHASYSHTKHCLKLTSCWWIYSIATISEWRCHKYQFKPAILSTWNSINSVHLSAY